MENNPPKPSKFFKRVALSGDVAYLHYVIAFYQPEDELRTLGTLTETVAHTSSDVGEMKVSMDKAAKDVLDRDLKSGT